MLHGGRERRILIYINYLTKERHKISSNKSQVIKIIYIKYGLNDYLIQIHLTSLLLCMHMCCHAKYISLKRYKNPALK